MKKVNKKNDDGSLLKLDERLSAYGKEKIQKPLNSLKTFSKGTLAILAPLAAASLITSDLNAQCGEAIFNSSGLDVDGDGVIDFEFNFSSSYLYVTPVGTFDLGISSYSSGYVAALASGSAINGTNNYTGGTFQFQTTVSSSNSIVYVPITNAAGNLGFIEFRFDGNGGFQIDVNQTGLAAHTDPITAGDCISLEGPLPLNLTNLEVDIIDKQISLSWETENEINNSGFEIQRSSDGQNFYKVGWVEGSGTTNLNKDYNYLDKDARANVLYYYRLKQMDLNGKFDFSPIVNAELDGNNKIIEIGNIYPNPVNSGPVRLEIISTETKEISYELINALGQTILAQRQSVNPGLNNISLETSNLTNGTYFVKISDTDFTEFKKLIIQTGN